MLFLDSSLQSPGLYVASLEKKKKMMNIICTQEGQGFPYISILLAFSHVMMLTYCTVKHFNHPHPYIEIATATSDTINFHVKNLLGEKNFICQ